MECPKCKSIKLQRKGMRAGKQRYKCTECGSSFTEGVKYHPLKHYEPLTDVVCPGCGGTHIIRDGKLQDGTPRYQCNSCGLNFSPKTLYSRRKKVEWKCPYCGGTMVHAGFSKFGYETYFCKNCKKSCTGDETGKPIKKDPSFRLVNKDIACPHCGTFDIKRAGYNKHRVQKYECNVCKRAFTQNTKPKRNIEEAIKAILKGHNIKKVASACGYSSEHLRKVMSSYYKTEHITLKQKTDIIKYGYYLKVPMDYMAEYIKCSEHKCKEVLTKFKNSIMSTSLYATSQSLSKTY